jgi:hypothetical protein
MALRFRGSPRTKATRSSKSGFTSACILCAFIVLFLTACGGDESSSSPGTATEGDATSTTAQAIEMSPEELGDAIGATWSAAMQKLVALLEGQPEPATVQGEVEQLKEASIAELVAFGRTREALSDSDKAKVDSHTVAALEATADEPWYVSYMDIYNAYPEDDLAFKNLLASFNILTQYADFDLLKQQAPEEAARLGIE